MKGATRVAPFLFLIGHISPHPVSRFFERGYVLKWKREVPVTTKQNPLTPEGSNALTESFMAKLRDRFTNVGANEIDIADAILEDHKALKDLIPLLKGEGTYKEKRAVFELFSAALVAHAKPEEQTWYEEM
jgi:hypothetical protein